MSSRIDKEELKSPDLFHTTTDRLFHWIETNAAAIAGVLGLALLVGVGWISYGFFETRAEKKAAEAMFESQEELRKIETKVQESRREKMTAAAAALAKKPGPKTPPVPQVDVPVDYQSGYAPAVGKAKDAIQKHPASKVALVAAMNLAEILIQQKQFGEALAVLQIPTYHPKSGDILSALFLMHRGLAELENKKFDEAVKTYQSVVDASDLKSFHAEALLKLGVSQELKGDLAKAKETYGKLTREFPDSEASTSAQQFLRLLEIKTQQG